MESARRLRWQCSVFPTAPHRKDKKGKMLGPPRKILWAHNLPIPNNPFPLLNVRNYSLGHSSKSMALFVPLLKRYPFTSDLKKQNSEKSAFGMDRGLLIPQDLQGHGISSAFQHPIKVHVFVLFIHFLLSLSRCPELS